MKRYETMSKEEIIDFVAACGVTRDCGNCPSNSPDDMWSGPCAAAYLQEEVPEPLMVRRYQNICCKQDLDEAFEVVRARCVERPCNGCAFEDVVFCTQHLFIKYLCELEPERPAEWYKEAKYDKSRKIKA